MVPIQIFHGQGIRLDLIRDPPTGVLRQADAQEMAIMELWSCWRFILFNPLVGPCLITGYIWAQDQYRLNLAWELGPGFLELSRKLRYRYRMN